MDASRLDICSMIQKISGISQPFNYYFEGNHSNKNLFARIVRGEISQWRVWEDDRHVAFLSPVANIPGFTVLVPRVHLSSDIFSLDAEAYSEIVAAAHTVARILKQAFGVDGCGMISEGFEIEYAHVKLIPVHKSSETAAWPSSGHSIKESAFEEKYEGYVTSLNGPKIKMFNLLLRTTPVSASPRQTPHTQQNSAHGGILETSSLLVLRGLGGLLEQQISFYF